ncbi:MULTISPECIES: hypothetical protein [Brevibacterium]|uniref:hypothetical protein n=1 Tax=Brevibacterium TaxID=1696 RepID=UPI000F6548A0|nr:MULTISPECIES: hypothetical protein [Brevibacterium]AZL08023.1 hypothetical protein CXR26_01310 [Brevibacterium aurantiacum]
MDKAIKAAAWVFVITGGLINVVFLFTLTTGSYPMWALAPVLIGVALFIVYISRRKRIQE